MITIIQNKDRATFKVINDVTFDEVTVMMQDTETADEMIYHLLVNVIKGEQSMKKFMYIDSGIYEIRSPEFFDSEQEAVYYMINDFCIVKNISSNIIPDVVNEATLNNALSIINENGYLDDNNNIDMSNLCWHGTTLDGDKWWGQIFEVEI